MTTKLPYDAKKLPRELKPFYISASEQEISEMLESIGENSLDGLFNDITDSQKLDRETFYQKMSEHAQYEDLVQELEQIAAKNKTSTSFIGDGLPQYSVHEIVPYVSELRGLTTAYTPYQPERSQGTLYSLWLYANSLRMLTGFEAINASLYERSTCLSEALNTSLRLVRKSNLAIVSEGLYPGDLEVIETLAKETPLKIEKAPLDPRTGKTDLEWLKDRVAQLQDPSSEDSLACVAFAQVNSLGLLEDVNQLTDLCWDNKVQSIAIVDPILLASKGLKAPAQYGSRAQGAHMIVAEGQHLCIGPNYGGPGLGIFGIRYNSEQKLAVRSTAGRYVGKAKDEDGNSALCMVLSTREQHIRREKATSNICSNQSFVATLAGASLLARGDEGLSQMIEKAHGLANKFATEIQKFKGIELSIPTASFYNQVLISIDPQVTSLSKLLSRAREGGLQLGVDVSERLKDGRQHLLTSFFDIHSNKDLEKLISFFAQHFEKESAADVVELPAIPQELKRGEDKCQLPQIPLEKLKDYYQKLSSLNLSPDDNIYPLGSCTMKYNPYINDYAAGLKGFTDIHPQAPEEDAQGCLEILYQIQEMFKAITGLPAVTTQPVAGAQGELVGLKMFQAYHRDRSEAQQRNIVLIPRSAHGTNPATATMAGFETKKIAGQSYGIVTIEADASGQIDLNQLSQVLEKDGPRVAAIMVTNPNTAGILESNFAKMAEMVHAVGGLVYMDGANMNAVAGYLDLNKIGVDAVHNNLHKTWTIPHGGGGPGDAIVAVSDKLVDYLPGRQVYRDSESGNLKTFRPEKSIGSFHRHHGNFAHKVRAYTYLRALGPEGIRKMSAVAVLSARYLYQRLKKTYPVLPAQSDSVPRMHEFILTIAKETFDKAIEKGTPKSQVIPRIGKLFLDFGLHAPTVAFPEVYGLMVEPTESFSKKELDQFCDVVEAIHRLINENPEVLTTAPHFTPVRKVDEVAANKELILSEQISDLPQLSDNPIDPRELSSMAVGDVCEKIVAAHQNRA